MKAQFTRFRLAAGVALLVSCAISASAADPDRRLVDAAAQQDRSAVRGFIKAGVNVNTAQADGATALMWASHWDDLEAVDLLLASRAAVNAANDRGVTALALA